jgi:hypothetical protein
VLGATAGLLPAESSAAEDVQMIVLRENGVGSASTAQKYIDGLMQSFARVNGWSSATGKYHTRRQSAEAFIAEAKPSYGFLSLGAYLALRDKYKFEAVGQASISGGGEQYYVISKTAKTLDDCKGQTLTSNHAGDARFVDNVVFAGAAKLSDFELEEARRPLQPLKQITRDEAVCALVDDAQLKELGGMDGAESVKPVWFSKKLPSVVVVAFPGADTKSFTANLGKVCQGEGKSACSKAGIKSLKKAPKGAFKQLHKAYDG